MIQSMTGFGKAEGKLTNKKVTIQLKSLNSKQTDITVKTPNSFKEKELSYRRTLSEKLNRGKIEMYLSYESDESEPSSVIDKVAFQNYYNQLSGLEQEFKISTNEILPTILKLPDILKNNEKDLHKEDWEEIEKILNEAISNLIQFRIDEGKALSADLSKNIHSIESLLSEALKYESERTEIVRSRLITNLEESQQKEKINTDRFEQEMIYYIEKYDISEEKVRLKAHCDYFIKTMSESEGQGKKLGFISQEIGREINTLGSKANHVEMQKLVVQMKEQLEKVKEQILNVL